MSSDVLERETPAYQRPFSFDSNSVTNQVPSDAGSASSKTDITPGWVLGIKDKKGNYPYITTPSLKIRRKVIKQLQKAMQEVREEYFVIIQRLQDFTYGKPMFRMKFPVNITWEELTSGNYISAVLLEMSYNEYFVFGKSGNYVKYSANDYEHPMDLIGFKPELAHIFQGWFKLPKEEQEEIREWWPQKYKELIKL